MLAARHDWQTITGMSEEPGGRGNYQSEMVDIDIYIDMITDISVTD